MSFKVLLDDLGSSQSGVGYHKDITTIVALRASNEHTRVTAIQLSGYATAGDGGGGEFVWSPGSTAADDGGGVIKPSSVSGAGRWIRIVRGHLFAPDFGLIAGDPTAASANSLQLDAMIAALPSAGGRIHVPPGYYYLGRSLRITKPLILEGSGGGLNAVTTFKLPAAASIVVDSNASAPQNIGGQFSDLRNFAVEGTIPPKWQANHAYNAGNVVTNPYPIAGFTNLVYVAQNSGTSGNTTPAFTVRAAIGYTTEGQTFSDGTVTWKAVSSPGIWFKAQAYMSNIYVNSCPGDGFYGYGYIQVAPATNCSNFKMVDCRAQLNLGRGLYLEGTDAQAGNVITLLAQANWGGGIYDNSDVGNTYLACLCEANGPNFWGANLSTSLFNGAVTVPTPANRNGFFYALQTPGTTGNAEPAWPVVVGQTVNDGTAVWVCAGTFADGQAYRNRNTGLNCSVFLGCYEEPDQQFSDLYAHGAWLGALGGFFTPASTMWRLSHRDFTSGMKYVSGPGITPAIKAEIGNPVVASAFGFNTADGTHDYTLVLSSDLHYWQLLAAGSFAALALGTEDSDEGRGAAVFPTGLYVGSKNTYPKRWQLTTLPIDQIGAPPSSSAGTLGDIVFQRYTPANLGGSQGFPSAWVCTKSAPGATWDELYFDRRRYLFDVSLNPVGNPFVIALVLGTTRRLTIRNNGGGATKQAIQLPTAVAGDQHKYEFVVTDSGGIRILAQNNSSKIRLPGSDSSAGGYIESTQLGAKITLEPIGPSDPIWYATYIQGTWTAA